MSVGSVKKSLNSQLCTVLTTSLETDGNKMLATLPTMVKLDSYTDINFAFLQAPVTTTAYLMTDHLGAFVPREANTTLPPFPAGPMPQPVNTTRMFYVFLNEYLINSVGDGWHQSQSAVPKTHCSARLGGRTLRQGPCPSSPRQRM